MTSNYTLKLKDCIYDISEEYINAIPKFKLLKESDNQTEFILDCDLLNFTKIITYIDSKYIIKNKLTNNFVKILKELDMIDFLEDSYYCCDKSYLIKNEILTKDEIILKDFKRYHNILIFKNTLDFDTYFNDPTKLDIENRIKRNSYGDKNTYSFIHFLTNDEKYNIDFSSILDVIDICMMSRAYTHSSYLLNCKYINPDKLTNYCYCGTKPIHKDDLPKSLKSYHLYKTTYDIKKELIPDNIERLSIDISPRFSQDGYHANQDSQDSQDDLEDTCETESFIFEKDFFPKSLKHLIITTDDTLSYKIQPGDLHDGLEELWLDIIEDISLEGVLPQSLKKLVLSPNREYVIDYDVRELAEEINKSYKDLEIICW